jgi:hypothetical protein
MRNVNWEPIQTEGKEAFIKFQELMQTLGQGDPKWRVTIPTPSPQGDLYISAYYFESENAAKTGTTVDAVAVTASMNAFMTSGDVFIRGNEAWEFDRSENVGGQVASILTDRLLAAGLAPRPDIAKTQEGRMSSWFASWNIYPRSHPAVMQQK